MQDGTFIIHFRYTLMPFYDNVNVLNHHMLCTLLLKFYGSPVVSCKSTVKLRNWFPMENSCCMHSNSAVIFLLSPNVVIQVWWMLRKVLSPPGSKRKLGSLQEHSCQKAKVYNTSGLLYYTAQERLPSLFARPSASNPVG